MLLVSDNFKDNLTHSQSSYDNCKTRFMNDLKTEMLALSGICAPQEYLSKKLPGQMHTFWAVSNNYVIKILLWEQHKHLEANAK